MRLLAVLVFHCETCLASRLFAPDPSLMRSPNDPTRILPTFTSKTKSGSSKNSTKTRTFSTSWAVGTRLTTCGSVSAVDLQLVCGACCNLCHSQSFPFSKLRTPLGCSDARVPANEIMGEPPGSVFVARNVANMVVTTDMNLMSALQYAVNVLKVPHIIVCGHYDCGGVRASMVRKDHVPPLENWLRNIRDV
jgi:hypothetical protein